MRSRRILFAAAVGLLLAAVGGAGWRWAAAGPDVAVPTCDQLAAALPASVSGTWTVRRAEPARAVTDSSVSCRFEVVSADLRFAGDVTVFLVADTDTEKLRREVRDGPCDGDRQAEPTSDSYVAAKECVEVIGGQARTGLFAANQARFTHIVAAFTSPSAAPLDVIGYARHTARATADQSLTLPADT